MYHINAVDEITQFEIVCAVEKINEHYLIPILEQLMEQFPFVLQGFHADNGSEYINKRVAQTLHKLWIEFTKSRPRHSNDNALVESKNVAIVRKHLGYPHIPQKWAPLINRLYRDHLNPYVNYHRPCFFPVVVTDPKGKQKKYYPYEQLKSLSKLETFLKAGITFKQLDEIAFTISDNEAAKQLKQAKQQLFNTITEQEHRAT